MFEELFVRKTLNVEKALSFGFATKGDAYHYETEILDGKFRLQIVLSSAGRADTTLIEKETNEEYVLYKTNSTGSFVGKVRSAIETILIQVSEHCYDIDIFKSPQAKEVIRYVREKYGDELEFLWKKFPDNAVWRRRDTGKWYGAILTVAKGKLGLDSNEMVEILDLRIRPEKMAELLSNEHYYPGWHMNKKNWYTVILDGSVASDDLCDHIDASYQLAF